MAYYYIEERAISIHMACSIFNITVMGYYYQSVASDENHQIWDLLIELTTQNKN